MDLRMFPFCIALLHIRVCVDKNCVLSVPLCVAECMYAACPTDWFQSILYLYCYNIALSIVLFNGSTPI